MPCMVQENSAPRGSRFLIAIIGRTNVGKSMLLNALVGEKVSITSERPGTTTDTVVKHYELTPFGPVTFYDTAGLDDATDDKLSAKRIAATMKVLYRADMALLVIDDSGIGAEERDILKLLKNLNMPYIIVGNKCEEGRPRGADIYVSARQRNGIYDLKSLIVSRIPKDFKKEKKITTGLFGKGDVVTLVTPIDSSAPKGRMILPQMQVLREILDVGAFSIVTQGISENILSKSPKVVITDSQVIEKVAKDVSEDIPLTTFSILYARAKGNLNTFVKGVHTIDKLRDGDKIMIAEACSHNFQDDDIGRVKIPKMLTEFTGKKLIFDFCTGHDFPDNLQEYRLIIQCGACMLGAKEVLRRVTECERRCIPITNYGLVISKVKGVLERVIEPFRVKDPLPEPSPEPQPAKTDKKKGKEGA